MLLYGRNSFSWVSPTRGSCPAGIGKQAGHQEGSELVGLLSCIHFFRDAALLKYIAVGGWSRASVSSGRGKQKGPDEAARRKEKFSFFSFRSPLHLLVFGWWYPSLAREREIERKIEGRDAKRWGARETKNGGMSSHLFSQLSARSRLTRR